MIRINLLPGQQKRRAGPKLRIGAGLSGLLTQVKNPLLLGVIGAWILGVGVVGSLWTIQTRQIAVLTEEQRRVEADHRRFNTLIQQKRRAEGLRDSLVAELTAIRDIDSDRYVWPHILEEITKAMPDYTWLTSVEAIAARFEEGVDSTRPPVRFQIEGRTSDLSAYTRFVSQLATSPWIRNAEFGAVQSVMEQEQPVSSFTVTATYRVADSAFIRTVPVQQSVR